MRRFYQRLNAGDLAVVDEVVSDAFIEHELVPGLEPTKAGLRQLFEMFHAGFDEASIQVDDIISDDDKVFVLARMTGKHGGEFMGIPASGNHIDVNLCDFSRVHEGSLVGHWGVMDAAQMQRQLSSLQTNNQSSHRLAERSL